MRRHGFARIMRTSPVAADTPRHGRTIRAAGGTFRHRDEGALTARGFGPSFLGMVRGWGEPLWSVRDAKRAIPGEMGGLQRRNAAGARVRDSGYRCRALGPRRSLPRRRGDYPPCSALGEPGRRPDHDAKCREPRHTRSREVNGQTAADLIGLPWHTLRIPATRTARRSRWPLSRTRCSGLTGQSWTGAARVPVGDGAAFGAVGGDTT